MKKIWYIKNWIEIFIETDFLLTPLVIDRWKNCDDDNTFAIFIFGFRIFLWKRW